MNARSTVLILLSIININQYFNGYYKMEKLYLTIEKSVKKVRPSENISEYFTFENLTKNNDSLFKKDTSYNRILNFKIFDSIKGKNLHFNICLTSQRIWIGYLIKYLNDFINYEKKKCVVKVDNPEMDKIIDSLKDYILMKESFVKPNFNLNPKFYKASSKIDKDKLINELDSHGGGMFSCHKYANENGHSKSTVLRFVKKVLCYSYVRKRLQDERAYSESTENCTSSFLIYVMKMIENNYELIFMDESSFDNLKRAKKRWVNKRKMNKFYESKSLKSVGLISCISKDKLIHYMIRKLRNNHETIIYFLKLVIKEIRKDTHLRMKYNQKKICLILDNATIHKTREVIAFLNSTYLNVCFLPPYSPNCNPVEKLFLKLKLTFYQRRFTTV
jgi:transposase